MIKIESQKMLVRFEAEIKELELSYDKRSDNVLSQSYWSLFAGINPNIGDEILTEQMAIEGNQSKQAVQVESEMMNEVDRQSSGDVSLSLSKEAVASKKQTRSIHVLGLCSSLSFNLGLTLGWLYNLKSLNFLYGPLGMILIKPKVDKKKKQNTIKYFNYYIFMKNIL